MATTSPAVTVELLYFRGCPNYWAYLPRLRSLLPNGAELVLREVATDEAAEQNRFLGSPTVRVDGRDIEPEVDARAEYGLQCRLYRTPEGWSGVPPDAWVLNALQQAPPQVA